MDNKFDPNTSDEQKKRQEARDSMQALQEIMQELHIEQQDKPKVSLSADQSDPEPKQEPEQPAAEPPKTEEPPKHHTSEPEELSPAEEEALEEDLFQVLHPNHKEHPHHEEPKQEPSAPQQPRTSQEAPAERPHKQQKQLSPREARRIRRRNRRLLVSAAVLIVVIALLCVACSGISKLVKGSQDKQQADNTAAQGSAVVEDEQQVQDDRPASEQESKQYLAIKDDTSLPSYALEYPGMYADAVSTPNKESKSKVCYLTFDDGPSSTVTPDILDTLKENDVKATFFVVTSTIDENTDLIKRIIDEGHTLGIHADRHEYSEIYKSVDAYLADFAKAYDTIYELTGYKVQCFRFPGGSNNGVMSKNGTYDEIVTEMTRRGFEYFDWNAYDHDAEGGNYSVDQIINYAVDEVNESSRNDVILLMHDTYGKEKTAQALPSIIKSLKKNDIELLPLTDTSRPVHFSVNDNTPSEFPDSSDSSDSSASDDSSSSKSDSSSSDSGSDET